MPAWFLRLGAPVFYKPLTRLFNLSIATSTVPVHGKVARIRPIPKVSLPSCNADFRPISVTPVLAWLMEKVVVRELIYPALLSPPPDLTFADQFAFQPSGSTTAALVYLLRTISQLLTLNPYVIVIALDFSKAFYTVRHSSLLKKFAKLDLPDNVYNWLVDYFEDHSHCTSYQGKTSKFLHISASNSSYKAPALGQLPT